MKSTLGCGRPGAVEPASGLKRQPAVAAAQVARNALRFVGMQDILSSANILFQSPQTIAKGCFTVSLDDYYLQSLF
jgi:hypothetical protein